MFRVVVMVTLVLCLLAGGAYVVLNKDSSWAQQFQATLLKQQASQAFQERDWGQAQHVLEALHQSQKNDPDITRQLAQVYQHQAKQLAEVNPDKAFSKNQKADTLYQQGLQTSPQNVPLILAFCRFIIDEPGRLNDGVNAINAGLKEEPHHPELLSMMASIYQHAAANPAEDRPEMIAWLEDWSRYYATLALKEHPDLFTTRFKLGVLEQNRALNPFDESSTEHLTRAARQYCNALLIQPSHIQSRYNLGLTLVNLKAVEEGFEQLNTVKKLAMNQNHMAQAQELALEIQSIHNSVFNGDPSQHTDTNHVDGLLHQCINDSRIIPSQQAS